MYRRSSNKLIPPEILLEAYEAGIFPMAESGSGEINWYEPETRGIFPLWEFRTPRSLRQTIRKGLFELRIDTAFEEVMRQCASREETWISEQIIQSYVRLFELGYAHSVESWHQNALVGGLYGVALGAAFFGESMFSKMTDASKVALVRLVDQMKDREFELLDTQFTTPHLEQFGVVEVPRWAYMKKLKRALQRPRSFVDAESSKWAATTLHNPVMVPILQKPSIIE